MKDQRYLILMVLLLTGQSSLFGQRLTLAPGDEAVRATLDQGTVPVPDGQELYPIRPDTVEPAAYSTFWVYPDGHFETIDFEADNTTFLNTKAKLGGSSSNIHCYLTEKYINTDPPEDAVETGRSKITATNIPAYIDDSHTLDLFVNNDPRPKYKMVTAMSYNKNVEANNLYLFYNNVGKDSKPFPLFEFPVLETILPDYSNGEVSSEELNYDSYPHYFSNLVEFGNAIHFGLMAIGSSNPPHAFGRKRIFSVLKTNDYVIREDYPFGHNANLLGILTSAKSRILTEEEAGLVSSIGLPLDNSKVSKLGDSLYIVGIDKLQLPIGDSHDPNHLTLKKVCYEGDFLKMDYELTICNEFIQPETRIDIEISGLNDYIVSHIEFTSHPLRSGLSLTSSSGTWTYYPEMTVAAANHRFPECEVVAFTVTIPHGGDLPRAAKMLIGNQAFINYCVRFNSSSAKINVCDSRYSFIKIDQDYQVLECETTPSFISLIYPWWKYLLIVIIIVPIVWYFLRRKGPKV